MYFHQGMQTLISIPVITLLLLCNVCDRLLMITNFILLCFSYCTSLENPMYIGAGNKRGPDKALVFQPPRRTTAVRSPGSATHYLRKSPSPTAPAPPAPAATTPSQTHPPPNPVYFTITIHYRPQYSPKSTKCVELLPS